MPGTFLGPQQALVKFVKHLVDVKHIIVAPFNKIHDDQIKPAACGQPVACPADQIFRLLQIQLQSNGKGNGRRLCGPVIGIVADLGKVLPGNIGFVVDIRIFLAGPVNELQQRLGEAFIGFLQQLFKLRQVGPSPGRSVRKGFLRECPSLEQVLGRLFC